MTDSSREVLESMDKEHLIELALKMCDINGRLAQRIFHLEQQLNEMEDLDKLIESIEEK